jgi:hypothetical protein
VVYLLWRPLVALSVLVYNRAKWPALSAHVALTTTGRLASVSADDDLCGLVPLCRFSYEASGNRLDCRGQVDLQRG